MRDVTDNRTGELAVGEVKRGRGRPRKPDALSNAERQAAYRARRRTEYVSPMHRAVVDPEALQDVAELEDEMAELKAELAEQRNLVAKLQRSHAAGLANENRLRRQVALAEEERSKAFAANAALQAELLSAREAIDNYKLELVKIYRGDELKKTVTRKAVTKKGA